MYLILLATTRETLGEVVGETFRKRGGFDFLCEEGRFREDTVEQVQRRGLKRLLPLLGSGLTGVEDPTYDVFLRGKGPSKINLM